MPTNLQLNSHVTCSSIPINLCSFIYMLGGQIMQALPTIHVTMRLLNGKKKAAAHIIRAYHFWRIIALENGYVILALLWPLLTQNTVLVLSPTIVIFCVYVTRFEYWIPKHKSSWAMKSHTFNSWSYCSEH